MFPILCICNYKQSINVKPVEKKQVVDVDQCSGR